MSVLFRDMYTVLKNTATLRESKLYEIDVKSLVLDKSSGATLLKVSRSIFPARFKTFSHISRKSMFSYFDELLR